MAASSDYQFWPILANSGEFRDGIPDWWRDRGRDTERIRDGYTVSRNLILRFSGDPGSIIYCEIWRLLLNAK